MATKLTTPEARPAITHHAIIRFEVQVPHKLNDTQDDIVIDLDAVNVAYRIVYLNSEREVIDRVDQTVYWADWPAGFKTDMKSVYTTLTTDAKNKGLIDPGTDEPLE